ncbi:c-type cytochrome [Algoriphagus winogradskyi]|jgi:cytochrome c|uniref:Cytochrome c n=1 Tax=Algoriphagus winogradskyi TaxID=237017 RepID=A0ABY1NGX0_9BACT|nr:c-type cytochrome [Algoriphagus winogradskyi]SMP09477.1 cytochrome c [Algoriphagus winogradskyi]
MKITKPINLVLVALAGFTFACGGGEKTSETTSTAEVEAPEAAPEVEMSLEEKYQDDPIYIKGLAKLKTSDCTSCHMVERKIVGPSYADVAAKYENTEENINMLAEKVIAGGVGVWGEIPMPPHPALSIEDAKDMVAYVLLLKK